MKLRGSFIYQIIYRYSITYFIVNLTIVDNEINLCSNSIELFMHNVTFYYDNPHIHTLSHPLKTFYLTFKWTPVKNQTLAITE